MTDSFDPRSMLEAAQEAAGAGDCEAAEQLLREAAAIQEASLGPLHPDLASTLNDLASVCDRMDKLAEAERGYRRAHAIAVASLSPGHPFVATSLKNLLDFCAARGIPIWTPPAIKTRDETSSPTIATRQQPELAFELEEAESPSSVKDDTTSVKKNIRTRVVVATVGMAALVAVFFTTQWRGTNDSIERSSELQQAPPPSSSATPSSPTQASTPQPPPAEPTPATIRRPPPVPVKPSQRRNTTATTTPITVLNAQLCSALQRRGSPDWQCTPMGGPRPPGTFMFYTRLQTDRATTVEHRWYREGRLHQRMRLRVRANRSGGYRTYSSNTVSSERAGDWKVELRSADGTLLREEQFVVR